MQGVLVGVNVCVGVNPPGVLVRVGVRLNVAVRVNVTVEVKVNVAGGKVKVRVGVGVNVSVRVGVSVQEGGGGGVNDMVSVGVIVSDGKATAGVVVEVPCAEDAVGLVTYFFPQEARGNIKRESATQTPYRLNPMAASRKNRIAVYRAGRPGLLQE
jgi:hypothetical protein